MKEFTGKENGYTFKIIQLSDDQLTNNEYFTFLKDSKGNIIEYYTKGAGSTIDKLYSFIKPHLSAKKKVSHPRL